jgi:hypothetical protein
MAVNPTDSTNIITGANDEVDEPFCTPATGGPSSCPFAVNEDTTGVYWTTDSGTTWNQQVLHWVSTLSVASDGDPVVAFGPKPAGDAFGYGFGARAYFGSLAGCRCNTQELIAVAHSDDEGATWSAPVLATTRTNPVDFNDKIAIWADQNPSSPFFGSVYVSWTLFRGVGNFGESFTFSPEPIMFARSTDGGLTFGSPIQLTQAANNGAVGGRQGSTIRTGPDGAVYVIWDGAFNMKSAILGAKSTDGGVSFSRPFLVAFKNDVPSPFPGASFRTDSFPMADIDQDSGKIFVVWTDYTSGHAVVKMVASTDGGNTWTGPSGSGGPATIADVSGRSAFYPAAVKPDGSKVFVGFNTVTDKAAGTPPGEGIVTTRAYYVIVSNTGANLAGPSAIGSSGDPDASSTNSLRAQFIGDYNGASASSSAAWFSWTDSRNSATCSAIDTFRAGGTKPNIYDSCPANFGNTDIFVAQVTWP